MADTKTTALTENTTLATTDILYMVDDPGASPASQKVTIATLKAFIAGRVFIATVGPAGGTTASFTSIPATYAALELLVVGRSSNASTSANILCYFNNDTTAANYRGTIHYGYGTNTNLVAGAESAAIANISAANSPANSCGRGQIIIPMYAGTTFFKQATYTGGYREDNTSVQEVTLRGSIEWESTNAINRVDLTLAVGNWATGSEVRLYGLV